MKRKTKSTPLERDALSFDLLERYIDFNMKMRRKRFAFSLIDDDNSYAIEEDNDDGVVNMFKRKSKQKTVTYPLFLGQIAMLYELSPESYKNRLNKDLFQFIADNFRSNAVFIVNNQGELLYILIMETNKSERRQINDFFADHLDDLSKFQFLQTEYDPDLERFFLNDVKLKLHQETSNAALTFFN